LLAAALTPVTAVMDEGNPPSPVAPAKLNPKVPGFELLELIGKGGMGRVYRARQIKLNRMVAIKLLPAMEEQDPSMQERFTREAQAMAALNHSHIVGIYDFGVAEGQFYIVMEYVDGPSLHALIQAGGVPPDQTLSMIQQICDGLQFAHDQGLIHRDIKPANILLDRSGTVKITDFGLARFRDPNSELFTLTLSNQCLGTPEYMAPEQLTSSHTVDQRADVYSLGVVFYQLLTGKRPVGKFPPPSELAEVDARLDEVVLKAMATKPERRYRQVSEIKSRVSQISGGKPETEASGTPRRPRRLPVRSWLSAVALLVLLLGTAIVFWQPWNTAPPPPSKKPPLEDFVNGIGMKMIAIQPGSFVMGSPIGEQGRRPDEHQHKVTLTRGYWLSQYEVTEHEFSTLMDPNLVPKPEEAKPILHVTREQALTFCRKLTERERLLDTLPEGFHYTLPTEAQWEYACRAGSSGWSGSELDEVAWYRGNSDDRIQPVGTKSPNAWGLHDMLGNAIELCLDWKMPLPAHPVTDPQGPEHGIRPVVRGGRFCGGDWELRPANRLGPSFLHMRFSHTGIRAALVSTDKPEHPKLEVLRTELSKTIQARRGRYESERKALGRTAYEKLKRKWDQAEEDASRRRAVLEELRWFAQNPPFRDNGTKLTPIQTDYLQALSRVERSWQADRAKARKRYAAQLTRLNKKLFKSNLAQSAEEVRDEIEHVEDLQRLEAFADTVQIDCVNSDTQTTTSIRIRKQRVNAPVESPGKGLWLAAFNRDRELILNHTFRTDEDDWETERFAAAVTGLPKRSYVILCALRGAKQSFNSGGERAIHQIGGVGRFVHAPRGAGATYYCIGMKGLRRGHAIERVGQGSLFYPPTGNRPRVYPEWVARFLRPNLLSGNVLWCSFDTGGEDGLAHNRSGRGPHGKVFGSSSTVRGEANPAMGFTSYYDYVDFGDSDALDFGTGPFSVSIWYRGYGDLLSKGIAADREGGNQGWHLFDVWQGPEFEIGDVSTPDARAMVTAPQRPDDGQWHHVVVVREGRWGGRKIRLYRDGVEDARMDVPGVDISNDAPLLVSGKWRAANLEREMSFKGSVDELMLWRRALGADEVKTLYRIDPDATADGFTRPPPPPKPVPPEVVASVSFTAPEGASGLTVTPEADGLFTEVEIDGKKVLRAEDFYIYFRVDDEFLFGLPEDFEDELLVRVEVFDLHPGNLGLQYDGHDRTDAYARSRSYEVAGQREWRTFEFPLPRARLANGQNGMADFRLCGDPRGALRLRSVTLERRR